MSIDYIAPNLRIVAITELTNVSAIEEILSQLLQLEEYCFIAHYHQRVEKERQKSWHDHRIKFKQFQPGDFVFSTKVSFLNIFVSCVHTGWDHMLSFMLLMEVFFSYKS